MPPIALDLRNQRFGRLVARIRVGSRGGLALWKCECDCGNFVEVTSQKLRTGTKKSCGCWWVEHFKTNNLRHGWNGTPEYVAFHNAKARCKDKKDPDYGGRGIRFLYEKFEDFLADVGPRPSPLHSLDRRKVDGNYEPGNCRWVTMGVQFLNRSILIVSKNLLRKTFGGSEADRIWEALRKAKGAAE